MSEILDAELLPDETEQTALARVDRRVLAVEAPRAELAVLDGLTVPMTDAEFEALVTGQLYIGFYNLSGQLPDRDWDFSGLEGITDEERQQIARYANRYRGVRTPNGARLHRYLTDGRPLTIATRVAVAPLERRRNRQGNESLRCFLKVPATTWLTHFAFGTRAHGVLIGAQFVKPMPMLPGNGLAFGMTLSQVRTALPSGAKALPSAAPRLIGGDE
jgi:hypothetical protein